jgi:protoporphyrinogen oxidase
MKKIVIIGAGPAGLTAAFELLKRGETNVKIIEQGNQVGGISKTIVHNGNRIDIGGHRFFSKSDWVMDWWAEKLPLSKNKSVINLKYHGQTRSKINSYKKNNLKSNIENVMLVRNRLSRIYYGGEFYDYPLSLNISTLNKLGLYKILTFGISYIFSKIRPIKPEKSLEDFFINRFGKLLYLKFFKEYTEKVWGISCSKIGADWGTQRIKSLSITKTFIHALKKIFRFKRNNAQTSLIENFIYPKYGPGQMWEIVAKKIVNYGGKIYLNSSAKKIKIKKNLVKKIYYKNQKKTNELECTHLISTMPIKELINISKQTWSSNIINYANNLQYRDFITVGLLYNKKDFPKQLKDNWIYIQESGMQVGRIQIFNNWSPWMVKNKDNIWLGLEYFCNESDQFWNLSDKNIKNIAQKEIKKIGVVKSSIALDSVVIKVPKAYPGYFGKSYKNFHIIKESLDKINNLYLIGRNGMHRYNNQDHSMLTAKEAVEQIITGANEKNKIWSINIGDEYHEEIKN